jgi:2-polyprenyl-3-methyl-5-hydroxy-6-metoxy-1,4-benzoquinol methylase
MTFQISFKKNLNIAEIQSDPFLLKKDNYTKYKKDIEIIAQKPSSASDININWIKFSSPNISFSDFDDYFPKNKLKVINRKKLDIMSEYVWKFQKIQNDKPFNILAIGCGFGIEIYFLSKFFKNSKITACNWIDDLPENLITDKKIDLYIEDINDYLMKNKNSFDLIFSNYVLEHMYNINDTTKRIYGSLNTNGFSLNCIPLHNYNKYINDKLNFISKNNFDQFDMSIIDLGHPWKTNPVDVKKKFKLFDKVEIYGNRDQVVRYFNYNIDNWKYYLSMISFLNKYFYSSIIILFRSLYKVLKYKIIIKMFYKIEKKLFFSNYKVQNFVPSVMILAKKK